MASGGRDGLPRGIPRAVCTRNDLLGEGPLWDHRSGRLLWVDILRGLVHSWSAATGASDLLHIDTLIGSVALAGDEDLLLATSDGLMSWSNVSGDVHCLAHPNSGLAVRFNDGRVDAAGRFWVGTMALDPARYSEPLGVLYRYDPDGTLSRMEEGLTISNGLDWSPDGDILYLTDTLRQSIYAYDFDANEGTIDNRRIFAVTERAHGLPDGLVVDSDGCVWSACFGGNCLCRYDPDGKLFETVRMPISCPTAIAFGGADYSTAFVTTSQHALEPDHNEADAGSVFAVALQARGRPAAVFGRSSTA